MSDEQIKLVLSDISSTLDSLVVGAPATALPASRARYLVVLGKQLVDGEISYRQVAERIAEWDRKNRGLL